MIRPSALNLAERCGLSAHLSAQYPEAGETAERGSDVHRQIARGYMVAGYEPVHGGARRAVELLGAYPGAINADVELPVRLVNEEWSLVTQGTADAVVETQDPLTGDTSAVVLDWKTGAPEYVPHARDNLQLAAYAIGIGQQRGLERVTWGPVFLGPDSLTEGETVTAARAEWPAWIERIKRAASREPSATPGDHCGSLCWQRHHCPAWIDRAKTALATLDVGADLSPATVAKLVLKIADVKRAVEMAEEVARNFQRAGGVVAHEGKVWGPSSVAGRKTADVKALEADGLGKYVRQGAPYERWTWKRA